MSLILTLIMAFTIGFTGSYTEAPAQAPVEVVVEAPEVAYEAPVEVTVDDAQGWVDYLLYEADMERTPNVTILFTNSSNCGAELSELGLGGCTYTVSSNEYVIVISPELAWTDSGKHIFFHELAHTVGYGECEAEAYAHQFEEVKIWSYPSCETTGKP